MFWEIKNTQASSLCLYEKNIYIASSSVKETVFPECDKINRISSASHATLRLSDNGCFLALINPDYRFELYNTGDMSKPIFTKRWKDAAASGNLLCFFQNRSVIIPVQNALYALKLQDSYQLDVVYGDTHPIREEWHQKGHIISISTFNDEIAFMHMRHEPFKVFVIRMKGLDYSIVSIQELPSEFCGKYNRLIFDQKGGICLFSTISGTPMLYYERFPVDFLKPDNSIQLPPLSNPIFSTDGRYLTFQANVKENVFPEGWLIETSRWKQISIVRDRLVLNPSFSHDNKYWLVPGKKPLIIGMPEKANISRS